MLYYKLLANKVNTTELCYLLGAISWGTQGSDPKLKALAAGWGADSVASLTALLEQMDGVLVRAQLLLHHMHLLLSAWPATRPSSMPAPAPAVEARLI